MTDASQTKNFLDEKGVKRILFLPPILFFLQEEKTKKKRKEKRKVVES